MAVLAVLGLAMTGFTQGAVGATSTTGTATPPTFTSSPYTIMNAGSGDVLEVRDSSTADGARLQQWSATGGARQKFLLRPSDGGTVEIMNLNSRKHLDVRGARIGNSVPVIQKRSTGGDNQRFYITDTGNGTYSITAKHSGKALEVRGASNADGTPVQQYSSHGGAHQRWKFLPLSTSQLADDMTLPHEERPHGVPLSVGWAEGPRVGRGNDAGDWRAATAWGQAYEAASGNPAANTLVNITECSLWLLRHDGTWQRLQHTKQVGGAYYREDFAGDISQEALERVEPDGSVSVRPGDGWNYHFWPNDRANIDPTQIAGLVVTVRARLVLDDAAGPDDRSQARLLLGAGGDFWESQTAQWDNWLTNGDFAIGRLSYVTTQEKLFTAHTLTAEQLTKNPPPLNSH